MAKLTKIQRQNEQYRETLVYVRALLSEVIAQCPKLDREQRVFEAYLGCCNTLNAIKPEREVEWL